MHASELVELAALGATHGPVLIESAVELPFEGLERYWTVGKCRVDRWQRSIKSFATESARDATHCLAQREYRQAILTEVLSSEVLTRVWAAVLAGHDRRRGKQEFELVGRSIMLAHMETRNRVWQLLVSGLAVLPEDSVELNRLRRRVELWTDVLIGYLNGHADLAEFAMNPDRARQCTEDLRQQGCFQPRSQGWLLTLASLRLAFREAGHATSPNADLNARLASAIVSCFEPHLFDSSGLFRSLWMARLSCATGDAQAWINDCAGNSSPLPSPTEPLPPHVARRF